MQSEILKVAGISRVLYDLTAKPPGTTEWEWYRLSPTADFSSQPAWGVASAGTRQFPKVGSMLGERSWRWDNI